MIAVKKRLELLLEHYEMSQKQLSVVSGISENTISNAKTGKNIPSLEFFNTIYRVFPDINPSWWYMGIGEMFVENQKKKNQVIPIKKSAPELKDCCETLKSLEKEIEYLKHQIRDKEEIIKLLKGDLSKKGTTY